MSSGGKTTTINPTNEKELKEYVFDSAEDIEKKLDKAFNCYEENFLLEENKEVLKKAAKLLIERKEELTEEAAREMGKPIKEGRREVEICANICEYYSKNIEKLTETEKIDKAHIQYEPLGPVLGIEPWNYPFYQAFRFAAPNIAVGNPAILKHDLNVLGCAKLCEEIFEKAGIPEGGFYNFVVENRRVSDIIKSEKIRMVMFTGSTETGGKVAKEAGSCVKNTVLELGGSDPFIVLEDVDIEKVAEIASKSRTITSGESCIASKRFIIHEKIYEEFVSKFKEKIDSLKVGDPMDENTDVGPLIRQRILDKLHQQVQKSTEMGAKLITGGKPIDRDGFFYKPTILTDLPSQCQAAKEETFGPVASIFKVQDEEEAVKKANDTKYGLGACIFTKNKDRGKKLAKEIESGMVSINEIIAGSIGSDPRLPFGGTKKSGYGRELGKHGLMELVNKKVIWID